MRVQLVFQGAETSTCEEITDDSYVIDVAAINPADAAIMEDYDHYGVLSEVQQAVVRRIGVRVSDLWAAWQWRRGLETLGILADVENDIGRILVDRETGDHCAQCGDPYVIIPDVAGGVICSGCHYEPMAVAE
jgi:hypothetical protein